MRAHSLRVLETAPIQEMICTSKPVASHSALAGILGEDHQWLRLAWRGRSRPPPQQPCGAVLCVGGEKGAGRMATFCHRAGLTPRPGCFSEHSAPKASILYLDPQDLILFSAPVLPRRAVVERLGGHLGPAMVSPPHQRKSKTGSTWGKREGSPLHGEV